MLTQDAESCSKVSGEHLKDAKNFYDNHFLQIVAAPYPSWCLLSVAPKEVTSL